MDGGRPELPRSDQDCLPARNVAEWKPDDRFSPCRHCRPDRAGRVCRGGAGACRPSARRSCRGRQAGRRRSRRAVAAAAGLGDRAQHRHVPRPARLHRDGRDVFAVRPVGRALGGDVLHRLCRQTERSAAAGHLRVQRRSRRRLGFPQSRPGRSAPCRVRQGRPRRRRGAPHRQSGHLAHLHRPGADRSGRHRLEPAGQTRRRQRVLERSPRRGVARQGDRALCRQKRPRQRRRNSFSAKAMAASAPPRSRGRCRTSRASS